MKKIGKYKGAIVTGYPSEIDGYYSRVMMISEDKVQKMTNEEKMDILMKKFDEKFRCKACGNWKNEHTFLQALKCTKELAKRVIQTNKLEKMQEK